MPGFFFSYDRAMALLTLAKAAKMWVFFGAYWGFLLFCLLCAVCMGIRAIVRRVRRGAN